MISHTSDIRDAEDICPLFVPSLKDQKDIWREKFKGAIFPDFYDCGPLDVPYDNVGYVFIPRHRLWRDCFSITTRGSANLLEELLVKLQLPTRKIHNFGKDLAKQLQFCERTLTFLEEIRCATRSDFTMLKFDCGSVHAGQSPEVLGQCLRDDEFALDPLTVLNILYLAKTFYPSKDTVHHIQCPGAKYDAEGKGRWSDCMRWDDERGHLSLDWNWSVRARPLYVNATGFPVPFRGGLATT